MGVATIRSKHLMKHGAWTQMRGVSIHHTTEAEQQGVSVTAFKCPQVGPCLVIHEVPTQHWGFCPMPPAVRHTSLALVGQPWARGPGAGGSWLCRSLTHHFSHGQDFWKHFPTGLRSSSTLAPQCFLKRLQQMKKATTAVMTTKARARWKLSQQAAMK